MKARRPTVNLRGRKSLRFFSIDKNSYNFINSRAPYFKLWEEKGRGAARKRYPNWVVVLDFDPKFLKPSPRRRGHRRPATTVDEITIKLDDPLIGPRTVYSYQDLRTNVFEAGVEAGLATRRIRHFYDAGRREWTGHKLMRPPLVNAAYWLEMLQWSSLEEPFKGAQPHKDSRGEWFSEVVRRRARERRAARAAAIAAARAAEEVRRNTPVSRAEYFQMNLLNTLVEWRFSLPDIERRRAANPGVVGFRELFTKWDQHQRALGVQGCDDMLNVSWGRLFEGVADDSTRHLMLATERSAALAIAPLLAPLVLATRDTTSRELLRLHVGGANPVPKAGRMVWVRRF